MEVGGVGESGVGKMETTILEKQFFKKLKKKKLEHSSRNYSDNSECCSFGLLWLAASSWQRIHSCITSHAVFSWSIKSPRWFGPPTAQIWCLWLPAFPKTKITFEREEISDHWWDLRKYYRAADADSNKWFCRVFWTVWGPKVPTLKGTEVSLSCV